MSGPIKVVKTKLFIGNLDQSTQPGELNDLFSRFGTVLEASVIKDYGFVHFGSIEEAEKAVTALNNTEFHGKRLRVELSTSTVRHRPGQPEPANSLRHPRTRTNGKGNSNGISRYNSRTSSGGGGPMRRNTSAWIRNDVRPYETIPIDHSGYDRTRSYDSRSDPRHYFDERNDNSYDAPGYSLNNTGGQTETRHYRDLPPHSRSDGYSSNRSYDRHLSELTMDPYYAAPVPQGPPPPVMDPYDNYDPYQKYYSNRPRDPEFPSQQDYDLYSTSRQDLYRMANGQGSVRHDLPSVNLQPPQGIYPQLHRPHQSYSSGSSNYGQYYGAQQR